MTGEPATEGIETKRRRVERPEAQRFVQDYIVTPDQPWLNGFVALLVSFR